MFYTRQENIIHAASEMYDDSTSQGQHQVEAFIEGAEWSDTNPINRWISFKDLKPKEGKKVLIALKVRGLGDIFYKTFVWHDNMLDDNFHTLIAWQHIFELPKEMKNEQ